MNSSEKAELIEYLRNLKLESRLNIYDHVLDLRTRYFTVLLENIDHSHNISAVLRSCECFGIQDVYIVNDNKPLNLHKNVAMGAFKWLTLNKYNKVNTKNTIKAIVELKEKGYRIVATTPDTDSVALEDFDIAAAPAAFVFGTERTGISQIVKDSADVFLNIPTQGFTQSLNISVSAAIILQNVTQRVHQSIVDWPLTYSEKQDLMLEWLRKSLPKVDLIENRFKAYKEIK